jgi:poly-gamma-glutamate capsule biosynthesis protein CapA/YwtB (metallophosphatase superfamily)
MEAAMATNANIILLGCGDVGPVHGPPESYAELVKSTLEVADIRIGQCERVYSGRGALQVHSGGAHSRLPPSMASVFTACGFNILSLASNHSMDWGPDAMLDTKALLEKMGILTMGVGENLREARKPAFIERKGIRVAFLDYCSVLHEGYEAGPDKAGVAPLRIHTYYEAFDYQAGIPPKVVTIPYEKDLKAMLEDIAAAKQQSDILVLSLHWGLHFMPRLIADYQPLVAHLAFDAGADLILGTHAHVPKAVELYKGKVCFNSLSNFIMTAPGSTDPKHVEQLRKKFLTFYDTDIDSEYPYLPYGKDAKRSLVAKAVLTKNRVSRVSFLPTLINKEYQPEILQKGDPRFSDSIEYMEWASEGLAHRFEIEGNEVVIK